MKNNGTGLAGRFQVIQGGAKWRLHDFLRLAGASSSSHVLVFGGDLTARAMQTSTNKLHNYLKINAEPEQLDLFGWYPPRESTSDTWHTLSSVVCDQVASTACLYHGLSTEHASHLKSLILNQCSGDPHQPAWHDYVMGLASTMSFLPTPMQQTFHHSDRAALASDWAHVQSDLDQAWRAITIAERYCDEQQRERRREAKVAE